MNKSSVGLTFAKTHLPKHLHPYAHLVTYVVNHRVGWLGREDRELALLCGMAALDKAWQKWQENPAAYTEGQFCSYIKKTVDGIILTEYATCIRERQIQQQEYKYDVEDRLEEQEEIAGTRPIILRPLHPGYDIGPGSLTNLLRLQEQETLEELVDQGVGSSECELVILTGEEGEIGRTARISPSITKEEKLMLLLPEREQYMVRYGEGGRIAKISRTWGISRVRGKQIYDAGVARLTRAVARLRAGEKFETLLEESEHAQAIALKKEMAGKDPQREVEFANFCDHHSQVDRLTRYARNFFAAYTAWLNEEEPAEAAYKAFCTEENLDLDSDDAFFEYQNHLYTIHYFQPLYGEEMVKRYCS